jgi:hypothetical protein
MASMKQPPTIEMRLLSPMCIRVANADLALKAVDLIFASIGGSDVTTRDWTVTCSLAHPDGGGAHVKMTVKAYLVQSDGTYLDVRRWSGDALFGSRVFGLLNDSLTAFKIPSYFQKGNRILPSPPPGLKHLPAKDPQQEVPLLCLGDAARDELVWSTEYGIASWPLESIHHFKADHDEVHRQFLRGVLSPSVFDAHLLKMPALMRQGLKPRRCWKNRLPHNCGEVLEQVSMLICEGEMYHVLHESGAGFA